MERATSATGDLTASAPISRVANTETGFPGRSETCSSDAEDVRHFISELVLDPPASSADLAGPPHVDEDFQVLAPSTRLRAWSGMLSTGRTAASNSGHPDPSQP